MQFKLSPSSLALMKECPRCFWLTQHKVWKRPAGIFPSLPSGMDKILKTHFNTFMEKGQLPPELCENHECANMKLFDDPELLAIWRSNFKGIQWKDKKGNILRGAVDNILMKGKKLIVLDYKTRGYALKEDTAEHYQDQLDIYNFLLRKAGYDTEDYAFLLFYVPKEVLATGEVIFDTELVKMKINIKNAEDIFNKAITLLNNKCPGEKCEWCSGR
ncbi:MAG: PD-(D/E)XK nuclease family protein [Nanoarchaeota archaeon]|nr:PD-(D/E)XK nuclease family protein [Nanoarchaeota archaeon]